MKQKLALLLSASMLAGLVGCGTQSGAETPAPSAPVQETAKMTPGTYTATVAAMKGDMTVHVTVDEASITDISIDTVDTVQVIAPVVNEMIPEILAQQSLNVDSVTGATVSVAALKMGVRDCLTQAGADKAAFNEDHRTKAVDGADQQATVVVVGSGAAGLSTAIQLAKNGVTDIVLCEKLGYFGGTSAHSSGGAWVVGDTEFNKNTGFDYDADGLVEHFYAASGAEEGTLNEELIRNIAAVSADVFNGYVEEGMPWDLTRYTFGDSTNEMPVAWVESFYDTSWESGAGVTMTNFLVEKAKELGVDLRLNSNVTGLVTDGDAVVGVTVEGREENYTLYANKVVLATGGFQRNAELVEEIAPDFTGMIPFTGAGSTGDGIVMARELGAYVVGDSIGGARGLDMQLGYQGPIGSLVWAVGPVVNENGVRFAAETTHYTRIPELICAQPNATIYGITDSTSGALDRLEEAVELGYVAKADTLEELAEAMGLTDAAAFVNTIETYNADAQSGKDDSQFGVSNAAMSPVLEAPFYGVTIKGVSAFSLAGLAVDGTCRVITEDGAPIENLYGAGELICGGIASPYYPGSGTQVGSGLYEGRIIADDIAQALK